MSQLSRYRLINFRINLLVILVFSHFARSFLENNNSRLRLYFRSSVILIGEIFKPFEHSSRSKKFLPPAWVWGIFIFSLIRDEQDPSANPFAWDSYTSLSHLLEEIIQDIALSRSLAIQKLDTPETPTQNPNLAESY